MEDVMIKLITLSALSLLFVALAFGPVAAGIVP